MFIIVQNAKAKENRVALTVIKKSETPTRAFGKGCTCKILLNEDNGLKNAGVASVFIEPGKKTVVHTREVEEIIFAHKGDVWVITDNAEYELKQGDCIYIPAGTKHCHENKSNETIEQLFICAPGTPANDLKALEIIK